MGVTNLYLYHPLDVKLRAPKEHIHGPITESVDHSGELTKGEGEMDILPTGMRVTEAARMIVDFRS